LYGSLYELVIIMVVWYEWFIRWFDMIALYGSIWCCHYSVLLYVSGPSGSFCPALLSPENWVSLKPVLGGVRDVALLHYPSCTDSINPIQCCCF
jgi:hypothetical protein